MDILIELGIINTKDVQNKDYLYNRDEYID